MIKIIKNPSQIITVNTNEFNIKKGSELGKIDILEEHSIVIENGIIKDFLPIKSSRRIKYDEIFDLADKIVLPGLIDCHTHTVFAGSRADEFRKKLSGISYEEIDKAGGGINFTVKSVRKSSFDQLLNIVKPKIDYFISQGITTLEIKTGYGLSHYDEMKLLEVINYLNKLFPIDIIPTFLGAHTFPPEFKNDHEKYIDIITNTMLPFIAKNKLAAFCDAYCESTAFSPKQVDNIFKKASELGFKLKLHTDQFNSIGGIEIAIKHGAISVDHLEVISETDIKKVAESDMVAVLLPGVSFFLGYDYAPARKLIDQGAAVAISTDYNPGSSHIANLSFIMSLAAMKMKMTIEETISAVTINAAKALDMQDSIGSLEIGKKADLSIFNVKDYSEIVYQVGKNLNCMTFKNGKLIYKSPNLN